MPVLLWVSNSSSSGSDWELDEVPTVGTHRTRSQLRSTIDSHRKRSTLQRLSVVSPMNDNHDGPVPPGAGR
jgi:hypothetical protein